MKNKWLVRWFGCFIIAVVVFSSVQAEASSQSFKDVPHNHPYKEIIQNMQARGMINGYPDGTFKPNEKVSRKHVAQLLGKALQLDAKSETGIRYKDVPKNHPYYDAISKVTQAGIFSGDVNGNFNPEAPLTRVQMAKVLDLAFGLTIKSVAYFPDVSGNDWGYLHVNALYSN
ncbi:MAG: S-layer homology domain-containing protein, partial [Sporosarcina sp.]